MIQVFEPEITEQDLEYVQKAVKSGQISGSFGNYITDFEQEFASYCGCRHGVAVSSGTAALHLAVDILRLNPGDEVLVSACTNIATALAVYHNGGTIVPVDSEPETWNLDIGIIESLITPNTKGIIPVHIYGHPVDMDKLNELAIKHHLWVIEDAAEAHGSEVRGRRVGSFSDMACFSFYANKTITCGEGGMIVTNNKDYAELLRLKRNLAFTHPRFLHYEAGYNFRMTGMQAALGFSQLKRIDLTINKKRQLAKNYSDRLREVKWLQLPTEKEWATNTYWMYSVCVKEGFGISRVKLLKYLSDNNIDTRTFFYPMNMQPCFLRNKSVKHMNCPVAGYISNNGFYLPSSVNLTDNEVHYICDKIITYKE